MAKITNIIPKQHFEIIRDRIAAIIAVELDNQFMISGNYDLDAGIYIESNDYYLDKIDMPAINVSISNGKWGNESQGSSDGVYEYNIDFYTNSKTTDDGTGDFLAALKLQRLAGVVRAILKDPIYRKLDFTTPFIQNVTVSELNIRAVGRDDALNTAMCRFTFTVKANETTELLNALKVEDWQTKVMLGNTTNGYFYEGINY